MSVSVHDAAARRERHRGHRHPLAQEGGRAGRGRRAAARGVHRQGRHRDPVARVRHPAPRSASARTRPSRSASSWRSSTRPAPARRRRRRPRASRLRPRRRPRPRRRSRPSQSRSPWRSPSSRPPRSRSSRPPSRPRRSRHRRSRHLRSSPPQQAPPAAGSAAAGPAAARAGGAAGRPARLRAAAGARRRRRAAAPSRPTSGPDGDAGGAYVTPLVRKLAAEHGVDLAGDHRHRRRRPDPQAGRAGGGPAARAGRPGARRPAAARPAAQRRPGRPGSAAAGRRRRAGPGRADPAARPHREDVPAARSHRQADGRVAADRGPAHHRGRGRRHPDRPAARSRPRPTSSAREGVKLSFLPFFALATVEALKQHPSSTPSIDTEAGTITYHDAEHLGIAVDTERGLLVPVIHNAGDLNLAGLARKIADLAERTRTNKVSPDELGGGTFTLTNTGSRGALFDTPIINQPQVGILGTGAVVKRPVVVDDPNARRGHRGPLDGLPGADLRPPAGRRRRRGPVPGHGQGAAGGGRASRPSSVCG